MRYVIGSFRLLRLFQRVCDNEGLGVKVFYTRKQIHPPEMGNVSSSFETHIYKWQNVSLSAFFTFLCVCQSNVIVYKTILSATGACFHCYCCIFHPFGWIFFPQWKRGESIYFVCFISMWNNTKGYRRKGSWGGEKQQCTDSDAHCIFLWFGSGSINRLAEADDLSMLWRGRPSGSPFQADRHSIYLSLHHFGPFTVYTQLSMCNFSESTLFQQLCSLSFA